MVMNVDAVRPNKSHLSGIYPWGRYSAKMIDFYLYGFVVGLLAPPAVKKAISEVGDLGWLALCAAVVPLLEGASISAFGTTIGKAAFRISVLRADGSKLSLGQSVRRSYLSWLEGAWLGVPVLSLVALWNAYKEYTSVGMTNWDSKVGAKLLALRPSWWSWCVLAIAAGVALTLMAIGNMAS